VGGRRLGCTPRAQGTHHALLRARVHRGRRAARACEGEDRRGTSESHCLWGPHLRTRAVTPQGIVTGLPPLLPYGRCFTGGDAVAI